MDHDEHRKWKHQNGEPNGTTVGPFVKKRSKSWVPDSHAPPDEAFRYRQFAAEGEATLPPPFHVDLQSYLRSGQPDAPELPAHDAPRNEDDVAGVHAPSWRFGENDETNEALKRSSRMLQSVKPGKDVWLSLYEERRMELQRASLNDRAANALINRRHAEAVAKEADERARRREWDAATLRGAQRVDIVPCLDNDARYRHEWAAVQRGMGAAGASKP